MKYNAFISYRHADPDDYIAGLIHKKLETFRVPRRIRKATGIKKIERLFRDQEELPIDSSLSDNIDAALQESEFLIVICSPRLIESRWCRAEIENFIKIRDRDHILAVLVEGEPEEAFPDLIRFDEEGNPVEPLAADVRGATKAEMKRKLNGETAAQRTSDQTCHDRNDCFIAFDGWICGILCIYRRTDSRELQGQAGEPVQISG